MHVAIWHLPPVTSLIALIGELILPSSAPPSDVAPGFKRTVNSRWSHRNGSIVSSEPGLGVKGRVSCTYILVCEMKHRLIH
jgi:hypothetical protein